MRYLLPALVPLLLSSLSDASPLAWETGTSQNPNIWKRDDSNRVTSCGDLRWMPLDDANELGHTFPGYHSTVDEFCWRVDGETVKPGKRKTMFLEVTRKNRVASVIEFEVHNKHDDNTHTIREKDCSTYLNKMTKEKSGCYGSDNHDTRGGSFQLGKENVSYHGLAAKSELRDFVRDYEDIDLGKIYNTEDGPMKSPEFIG